MVVVVSPSKTQDFAPLSGIPTSSLRHKSKTMELVNILKNYSAPELAELMSISNNLSQLNYDRFQSFSPDFTTNHPKQAFFAFKGDVYSGIDAPSLSQPDLDFAQSSIRMLSGLYGVIRPLDLIQPYRLEFGTKLPNPKGDNLYKYWGSSISESLNEDDSEILINLASNEYFKGIDKKAIQATIINIAFKEKKGDMYKIIAIHAKRARGLMVNFIIKNRINDYLDLKKFTTSGYIYSPELSTPTNFIFLRD